MTPDQIEQARIAAIGQFIRSIAASDGDPDAAEQFRIERGWQTKGLTTESVPGVDANRAFAAFMKPASALLRIEGFSHVPARVPMLRATGEATASWAAEGQPIAVSPDLSFDRIPGLQPKRVGAIAPYTKELLLSTGIGVDAIVATGLANATGLALDRAAFDPDNAGDANTPTALTYGVTPIPFDGFGVNGSLLRASLTEAMDAAVTAGRDLALGFWILHPKMAIGATKQAGYPDVIGPKGGILAGLPALVSAGARDGAGKPLIVLVDAAGIALTLDGAEITVSDHATLKIPSGFVSLFQTDSVAAKAVIRGNFKVMLAGAVQWMRED